MIDMILSGLLYGLSGAVGVGIIIGIFTFFETFIQRGHEIQRLKQDKDNVWKMLERERSKR